MGGLAVYGPAGFFKRTNQMLPRYVRKDAQNERVDDNRIEFSLGH